MKNIMKGVWLLILWAAMPVLTAAEMDHSRHGAMSGHNMGGMDHSMHASMPSGSAMAADGGLETLQRIPASGKAREAGFDGRYAMESTSANNPRSANCAQGTRGLVMLSNEQWRGCGGKVSGASTGPVEPMPMEHQGMDHSAMAH